MGIFIEDHLYSLFKKKYNNSPQFIKDIFGQIYRKIPIELRYGPKYKESIKISEKGEKWSINEIKDYQWRKTERLIKYCYNNVPYYRKLFDERGLNPIDIQNFHDFKSIPFLTKDLIRKNEKKLIAVNYNKSRILKVTTGGSTGTPLNLYYEKGISRTVEKAFSNVGWRRMGFKKGDKIVVLRGETVNDKKNDIPYYFDPIKNRLVLSSYKMTDDLIPKYLEKINQFKPSIIHAYPSSLSILAQFMKSNKLKLKSPLRLIITSSETLYDWQKEVFKDVFDCRVYSWYGLNEFVALAGGCYRNDSFHFIPQFSYVEFVKIENKFAGDDEPMVEIVGTGFCNQAMPLLRYRTMDIGIIDSNECECGNNCLKLKKIMGREQNFFIDSNGSYITFTGHNKPIRPIINKVKSYQYIQEKPGSVSLKLDLKETLDDSDYKNIYNSFKELWPSIKISIEIVDFIPKTAIGKHLYLIRKFDEDKNNNFNQ